VDGQRDTSPPSAASCKDIARAPVTNWEPQCVTLAGYCYAVRHGMKVQLVTPYRVSHLQRYVARYAVTLQVCTHPKSGNYILAYRDVFVVGNGQDLVIGRLSTPYPKAKVIRAILVKCRSQLDVIHIPCNKHMFKNMFIAN
jgi:hypothetical protein